MNRKALLGGPSQGDQGTHARSGGLLVIPDPLVVGEERLEGARLKGEKVRQRVAREVVEASSRVKSQGDQIATARAGLDAASEALRLTHQRAEFGVAAVLERILAEQDLTRARNDYVRVMAEYDKVQYALLRAIGGITVDSAPAP